MQHSMMKYFMKDSYMKREPHDLNSGRSVPYSVMVQPGGDKDSSGLGFGVMVWGADDDKDRFYNPVDQNIK